jgi:hypothetical protein
MCTTATSACKYVATTTLPVCRLCCTAGIRCRIDSGTQLTLLLLLLLLDLQISFLPPRALLSI